MMAMYICIVYANVEDGETQKLSLLFRFHCTYSYVPRFIHIKFTRQPNFGHSIIMNGSLICFKHKPIATRLNTS